jgi:hypothetical protein
MIATDFARLVRGVRRRGDWHDAICPAHDDGRPSLSFKDGDRGLVVVCHAGCTKPAILRRLGLTMSDLFHERWSARKSHIVTTYPYHDERGDLLYEVVRFEPKSFAMRRPDGAGGWVWNMNGVRLVAYRLPDLQGHETVFVVEGEKDADALAAVGLPATTSAWGAGSWKDRYAGQLVAAGVQRVVILPDNDDIGRDYARAVEHSCRRARLDVTVLHLPGLPAKADVSDWLATGHDVEELLALPPSEVPS